MKNARPVLEQIENLEIELLVDDFSNEGVSTSRDWYTDWPTFGSAAGGNSTPIALRMRFELPQYDGELERLWLIAYQQ